MPTLKGRMTPSYGYTTWNIWLTKSWNKANTNDTAKRTLKRTFRPIIGCMMQNSCFGDRRAWNQKSEVKVIRVIFRRQQTFIFAYSIIMIDHVAGITIVTIRVARLRSFISSVILPSSGEIAGPIVVEIPWVTSGYHQRCQFSDFNLKSDFFYVKILALLLIFCLL